MLPVTDAGDDVGHIGAVDGGCGSVEVCSVNFQVDAHFSCRLAKCVEQFDAATHACEEDAEVGGRSGAVFAGLR